MNFITEQRWEQVRQMIGVFVTTHIKIQQID